MSNDKQADNSTNDSNKDKIEKEYPITRFNENGKSIDSLLRNRALFMYFMNDLQKCFLVQPIEDKCYNSNADNVCAKYRTFLC